MERRRQRSDTKVTEPQLFGLPHGDHPIWKMGFDQVFIALALCDLFAAINKLLNHHTETHTTHSEEK